MFSPSELELDDAPAEDDEDDEDDFDEVHPVDTATTTVTRPTRINRERFIASFLSQWTQKASDVPARST
jgi:hypothetical protein